MKGLRKFLMGNRDKKMKKGKNGKGKNRVALPPKKKAPKK